MGGVENMKLDFRKADLDKLKKDKIVIDKAMKDLERKRKVILQKINTKVRELKR